MTTHDQKIIKMSHVFEALTSVFDSIVTFFFVPIHNLKMSFKDETYIPYICANNSISGESLVFITACCKKHLLLLQEMGLNAEKRVVIFKTLGVVQNLLKQIQYPTFQSVKNNLGKVEATFNNPLHFDIFKIKEKKTKGFKFIKDVTKVKSHKEITITTDNKDILSFQSMYFDALCKRLEKQYLNMDSCTPSFCAIEFAKHRGDVVDVTISLMENTFVYCEKKHDFENVLTYNFEDWGNNDAEWSLRVCVDKVSYEEAPPNSEGKKVWYISIKLFLKQMHLLK